MTGIGHPHRKGMPLAICLFLLSAGLPVAFFLTSPVGGFNPDPLLLSTLFLLIYSSARLAQLVGFGSPRLFQTIFHIFVYVSLAVVPLAQLHTGMYSLLVDPLSLGAAQLMGLVAVLAVDCGALVAALVNRPPTMGGDANEELIRRADRAASDRLATDSGLGTSASATSTAWMWALSAAAVVATGIYVAKLGGVGVFFQSRRDLADSFLSSGVRTADSQVASSLLLTFGTVPCFILALVWILKLIRSSAERRRVSSWLWIVLLFGLNLIVNNPVSNARYWELTIVIGALFSLPGLSRNLYRAVAIGGVLAAVVFFPYSDYFRATASNRVVDIQPIDVILSTKDYDQSTMTANGIWWVHLFGHTNGRQLLGSIFFAIPRSIWPDKPLDTGVLIGLAARSPNVNLSSPIWLELWIDFNWLGLIAAMLIFGFVIGRLDMTFVGQVSSVGRAYVRVQDFLFPVLAGYMFIILRGPLLQSMSRLAVILLVALLLKPAIGTGRISSARAADGAAIEKRGMPGGFGAPFEKRDGCS